MEKLVCAVLCSTASMKNIGLAGGVKSFLSFPIAEALREEEGVSGGPRELVLPGVPRRAA